MRSIIILLTFACFSSSAQKMPDIDLYRVRLTEPDHTLLFEVKPAKIKQIKLNRYYHWYGGRTLHVTQGGYSGKPLNGNFSEFYLSRALKEKGIFKDGLKTGQWENWSEDGHLQQLITWKKGLRDGPFVIYDGKGTKLKEGVYSGDLLEGNVRTYLDRDSVQIQIYHNGRSIVEESGKVPFWKRLLQLGPKKIKNEAKGRST